METVTYGGEPPRTTEILADMAAIVDALYRFAAGQDLKDRALFLSAFTEDAMLDFAQPARRFGIIMPPLTGREAIAETVFANLGGLVTTHSVTNPRAALLPEDEATLLALVEAQHVRRDDNARHLLLKNIYRAILRREGASWRMRRVGIETVWFSGDPAELFPPAER